MPDDIRLCLTQFIRRMDANARADRPLSTMMLAKLQIATGIFERNPCQCPDCNKMLSEVTSWMVRSNA